MPRILWSIIGIGEVGAMFCGRPRFLFIPIGFRFGRCIPVVMRCEAMAYIRDKVKGNKACSVHALRTITHYEKELRSSSAAAAAHTW